MRSVCAAPSIATLAMSTLRPSAPKEAVALPCGATSAPSTTSAKLPSGTGESKIAMCSTSSGEKFQCVCVYTWHSRLLYPSAFVLTTTTSTRAGARITSISACLPSTAVVEKRRPAMSPTRSVSRRCAIERSAAPTGDCATLSERNSAELV